MYHHFLKSEPLVRKALYEAYSKKCAYCGDLMLPKNMHIDHILATNAQLEDDIYFNQYLAELNTAGFISDSIENYFPSCPSCNLSKGNRNFSVANLRFFHDEAQRKASKVLAIIDKYSDQDISFDEYDPDYDYWEKIDFSHQKDIAEAIAGYRLQPCHVNACPRLIQVEEIKKKLGVVDYVIVEGEPGCGKSITVYQAAFDFSAKGYSVYRYINKNAEDKIYVPQSNEIKHLVIIDDAQNLPQYILEQIIAQAQSQTKIVLVYTKLVNGTLHYSEPIRITNIDAVEAIAQDYQKRKQEILPIVQQFDKHVGDGMMNMSFERRVKNAATQNTPWLLNYTLRGGWHTVNEQLQAVYYHNKCGLLSVIIALFQIMRMDRSVDFKWLQTYIQKFDKEISWTENDLEYLIQKRLIRSTDDVRIVHIESAKYIVHCFYKISEDASKKLIGMILEDSFANSFVTEQGLIWLHSAIITSAYCLEEKVFSESLLDSVFSNLEFVRGEERRGFIVYFLERMFYLRREKNGKYYFKHYEQVFSQWLSLATSKNAYEYSQLVNALINERDDSAKSFVSKININSLLQNFTDSPIDNLYKWSNLLERLYYACDDVEKDALSKQLREPLIAKSQLVTVKNVVEYFLSMSEMYYLNPDLILELLTNNIESIQNLWISIPKKAIDIIGFEFLGDVCGLPFLSCNYKPSKKQRLFSKAFVNAISVTHFANYISHSLPRDWNQIYDLGRLLYRENKKRYSHIVNKIDFSELNTNSAPLWKKTNGDLHLLFSFIAAGNQDIAQQFFEVNKHRIEELGAVYIEVLPEQAIELYKNGIQIRLFEQCWNSTTLNALKALHAVSVEDYKLILITESSQFAEKINKMSILDFEKHEKTLYEILAYIEETCPDVLERIVPLLDYTKIKKTIGSMLKDSRFKGRCKKHFNAMIDLFVDHSEKNDVCELQLLKALK